MTKRRVLLLSATPPELRPDTDLSSVLGEIWSALRAEPGLAVARQDVRELEEIDRAVRTFRPHVVFNACEILDGRSASEAEVAERLEELGVAFTGSGSTCLRRCLSKSLTTATLRRAGVRVPWTRRVTAASRVTKLPRWLYPVIVKPNGEDGSVGIDGDSVVDDDDGLARAVAHVCERFGAAVIQKYIVGREVAVALLGWPVPHVLSPGEVVFDEAPFTGRPRVLTYASKWDTASDDFHGTRSVAADLPRALMARVSRCALSAYQALDMRDYGRVDMRIDRTGTPFVIDVNPNCDLSGDAGFMRAARRSGLDQASALAAILRGAISRCGQAAPQIEPRFGT